VTGTVVYFDRVMCFGRILGEDGRGYFVHSADVTGQRLSAGDAVEFEPGEARGKPRAFAARQIEEPLSPFEARFEQQRRRRTEDYAGRSRPGDSGGGA
jgi:cold shock CspA family protein